MTDEKMHDGSPKLMSDKKYDSRCYDLAEHFLLSEIINDENALESACQKLAAEIQNTVESFCAALKPDAGD